MGFDLKLLSYNRTNQKKIRFSVLIIEQKYQSKSKSKRDIILSNFQWNHNHEICQNFETRPSKNASKIFYTCGLCISFLNALRIDFWWLNFSPSILSIFFVNKLSNPPKICNFLKNSTEKSSRLGWIQSTYFFLTQPQFIKTMVSFCMT